MFRCRLLIQCCYAFPPFSIHSNQKHHFVMCVSTRVSFRAWATCSMTMEKKEERTVAACPFGKFLINLPAIKFWCSRLSVSGEAHTHNAANVISNGTLGCWWNDSMTQWISIIDVQLRHVWPPLYNLIELFSFPLQAFRISCRSLKDFIKSISKDFCASL